MIWLLATLIGGGILGAYAVLILPLAYLIAKRNRDWALAIYFLYGILVINEVDFSDFLSYSALKVILMLILPSLMALREMMQGVEIPRKIEPDVLLPLTLLILGAIYNILFLMGVLLILAEDFKIQHFDTAKGLLAGIGFPILAIVIIRVAYPVLYTPETQLGIVAASTILTVLLGLRGQERVEFRLV